MNIAILIGRLTKAPEVKKLQSGSILLNFAIAVDRGDKDKTTDFINCQAWGKTAEFIAGYFHKGDPIEITGRIQTRKYEADGQQRTLTEVVVDKANFVPKPSKSSNAAPQDDPLELEF